jgi:nucleoside-diphosphate-sugar epimerase
MQDTFLITGGAGFIGSNLVEHLLEAGHRVRVLDNFSTGHYANLSSFAHEIEIQDGDVTRAEDCRRAVKGVTRVVHLAAEVSVARSIGSPVATNGVNVSGTCEMLQAAKEEGVRAFVFASTCAVYGNADVLPIEEGAPLRPLSPYAASKLAAEHYVRLFRGLYGMPSVVFRLFNVYGPKQDPSSAYSGVISAFADRLAQGAAPTVFGDGKQTRDFIFVKDVVSAFAWAALNPEAMEEPAYNLGTGTATSVSDLYERLSALAGDGPTPLYGPAREGEVRHSLGSAKLYLRTRGMEASELASLAEGLEATARWFFPAPVRPGDAGRSFASSAVFSPATLGGL